MKASVLGQFMKTPAERTRTKEAEVGPERVAFSFQLQPQLCLTETQQWQENLPFNREKPRAGPGSFGGHWWGGLELRLEQTDEPDSWLYLT